MGCDIHAHVEIKVKGKWEHYSALYIDRSYRLFAKMAGVRSDEEQPIVPPRGLPEDCSIVTKMDADYWEDDGHTHSWLTAGEAGEVQGWHMARRGKDYECPPLFGYLFGNHIDTHLEYPDDARTLKDLGFEAARVVFWFDN